MGRASTFTLELVDRARFFDATTAAEMCWRSKRSAASDSWRLEKETGAVRTRFGLVFIILIDNF